MPNKNESDGCLICGQVTKKMTRGLCSVHYLQFNRHKNRLPFDVRDAFDEAMVDRGMILAVGPPGPRGKEDPFAVFAAEFEAVATGEKRPKSTVREEAEEIAKEVAEKLDSAKKKKAATPKKPRTSKQRKANQ